MARATPHWKKGLRGQDPDRARDDAAQQRIPDRHPGVGHDAVYRSQGQPEHQVPRTAEEQAERAPRQVFRLQRGGEPHHEGHHERQDQHDQHVIGEHAEPGPVAFRAPDRVERRFDPVHQAKHREKDEHDPQKRAHGRALAAFLHHLEDDFERTLRAHFVLHALGRRHAFQQPTQGGFEQFAIAPGALVGVAGNMGGGRGSGGCRGAPRAGAVRRLSRCAGRRRGAWVSHGAHPFGVVVNAVLEHVGEALRKVEGLHDEKDECQKRHDREDGGKRE